MRAIVAGWMMGVMMASSAFAQQMPIIHYGPDGGKPTVTLRRDATGNQSIIVSPEGGIPQMPGMGDDMPWLTGAPRMLVRCTPGNVIRDQVLSTENGNFETFSDIPDAQIGTSTLRWNERGEPWVHGMAAGDLQCASQILEMGRGNVQVGWRSSYNTFVMRPRNRFKDDNDRWCRDFDLTGVIDGQSVRTSGTACRCAPGGDAADLWCFRP